jgi:uncharacterized protein Usg
MIWVRKKYLVLVDILYWMPDYNNVLQEFIWETDDYVPKLPRVNKFLNYWHKEIDAVINEVRVSYGDEPKIKYTDFVKEL